MVGEESTLEFKMAIFEGCLKTFSGDVREILVNLVELGVLLHKHPRVHKFIHQIYLRKHFNANVRYIMFNILLIFF